MSNPAPAVSHVAQLAETFLPHLRPAERSGLALWVVALLIAQSCCERTILTAMAPLGYAGHALRARLREWLYDGQDRAAPCATSLDVTICFAPLLAWVLAWWGGPTLPLAIDATTLRGRVVVLSISVLYRGSAIPVAWVVLPHRGQGTWIPELERLLRLLAPTVPATMTVLVLTDRGLWSPTLWRAIVAHGWHPLMRIRPDATFAPAGQRRQRAHELVPGAGWCWVGEGVAFKHAATRRAATLLVVWGTGQKEPWLLVTDLPPDDIGVSWYGLRVWIELGFRALKSFGWHWERTRRSDPDRIARHWLALAVATMLDLAVGTRLEDADGRGIPPGRLRRSRTPPPPRPRRISVFARGLAWLHVQVLRGRGWWRALWLLPETLPDPPASLAVIRHVAPPGGAHA
ncbi:MAG: transposase [Gemmatimonadales bacterium]